MLTNLGLPCEEKNMNHVIIEQPRLGGRTQPNPVEESGTVPGNRANGDHNRSDACKQVPTLLRIRNGQLLADFVLEKNQQLVNTQFCKKKGKLWTFTDPKGEHHMLDYIGINTKWRNSVKNVEAYSSFASAGSDHRIVTMRVKLSLRAPPKTVTRARFDWSILRGDTEMQAKYSIEVRNRFEVLSTESCSATEKYKALIEANEQTAKALLPPRAKVRNERHSFNPEVIAARNQLTTKTKQYEISNTRAKRKEMNDAKAKLKEVYGKIHEKELKDQISAAENARRANQHSKCWKIIKKGYWKEGSPTRQDIWKH